MTKPKKRGRPLKGATPRKSTSITIDSEVLELARKHGLIISRIAEAALRRELSTNHGVQFFPLAAIPAP